MNKVSVIQESVNHQDSLVARCRTLDVRNGFACSLTHLRSPHELDQEYVVASRPAKTATEHVRHAKKALLFLHNPQV
jgi:hypothetical protein